MINKNVSVPDDKVRTEKTGNFMARYWSRKFGAEAQANASKPMEEHLKNAKRNYEMNEYEAAMKNIRQAEKRLKEWRQKKPVSEEEAGLYILKADILRKQGRGRKAEYNSYLAAQQLVWCATLCVLGFRREDANTVLVVHSTINLHKNPAKLLPAWQRLTISYEEETILLAKVFQVMEGYGPSQLIPDDIIEAKRLLDIAKPLVRETAYDSFLARIGEIQRLAKSLEEAPSAVKPSKSSEFPSEAEV